MSSTWLPSKSFQVGLLLAAVILLSLYQVLFLYHPEYCQSSDQQEIQSFNLATHQFASLLDWVEKKPLQDLQKLFKEVPYPVQDDPRVIKIIQRLLHQPGKGHLKISMKMNSTPQSSAIAVLLKNKTNGFFVECGGFDGEKASNTLVLESRFKWTGLLVEMDPFYFIQIVAKNRVSHALHACLSPTTHPTELTFHDTVGQFGHLTQGSGMKVACFPLYSVMKAMNRTIIDYFSLDVEGYEFEVLKTIPFDKLDIRTLSVEYEYLPQGDKERMVDFMDEKGYWVHQDIQSANHVTDVWVKDFIFVKKEIFPPPPGEE